MKYWNIPLACLLGLLDPSIPITERVGIPITKPTVFHFPEAIIDLEIGNQDYHLKIKGKSLLIFAQDKRAKPTTLFIRYGEEKDSYVLEVYPDENAPLQRSFRTTSHLKQEEKETELFPSDLEQEYYDYGSSKDGISVILTNIIHKGNHIYLRLFIENQTATQLQLSNFSFNYVTLLRKFFFLEEKKKKPVKAITGTSPINLAAHKQGYFVFSLPYYSTNGGLEIYLSEADKQGERDFQVEIPNKVLLQAQRKQ